MRVPILKIAVVMFLGFSSVNAMQDNEDEKSSQFPQVQLVLQDIGQKKSSPMISSNKGTTLATLPEDVLYEGIFSIS
ncbi:MAG: hypothetical protein AB7R69_06075 [Candidatus Babeliales bacterium]